MDELDRIESWKQIAAYLGKSERTVRRWQQVEGLPVHRHVHQQRGSVWAYKKEVDEWLATRKESPEPLVEVPEPPARPARSRATVAGVAAVGSIAVALALWRGGTPRATPNLEPEPLTALPGLAYGATFSPDGRKVAFHWTPGKPDPGIYVKEIGSETVTPLVTDPGKDFLYGPVWSPDGKTIAYLRRVFPPGSAVTIYSEANETWLCLIDAAGGPERRLIRIARAALLFANNTHLSWSADGTRILAPMADGGLRGIHWIPLSGGEPSRITSPPPGREWAPLLSPDGRAFLFMREIGPAQAATETVFRQELLADGSPVGEARMVYETRSMTSGLAWMPSGKEFVFCRADNALWGGFNSRLYRMPADGSRPPEPLGLGHCSTVTIFGPRGGQSGMSLAYGSGDDHKSQMWRGSADALDKAAVFSPSSRFDAQPSHSPDGSRVAFLSNRSGKVDVWIANADGSGARKLTDNANVSSMPRWSADGSRIVYGVAAASGDDGRGPTEYRVFAVPVAGGIPAEVRLGLPQGVAPMAPFWSLDGRDLYFWSGEQFWRARADGSGPKMLHEYSPGMRPARALTGDGAEMLAVKPGKPFALCRLRIGGVNEDIMADGLLSPSIAVSKRFIYYVKRADTSLYAIPVGGGAERRLGRMPLETPTRILQGLSVSPDDSQIIWAVTVERRLDLMLVRNFK